MKASIVCLFILLCACGRADSQEMAGKTEVYQVVSQHSLPMAVQELNVILRRLSDRIDKIEGIRGAGTTFTAHNNSTVTVTTAFTSLDCDVDLGLVNEGDKFFIQAFVAMLKGGTLGDNLLFLSKQSGTASFKIMKDIRSDDVVPMRWQQFYPNFPANSQWEPHLAGIMEITRTGRLTIGLQAASGGSNSTLLSIGTTAQLAATLLK